MFTKEASDMTNNSLGQIGKVGAGYLPGSSELKELQQRMMIRQSHLREAYAPLSEPTLDEVNALQIFYNDCLGNIEQVRYGVPFDADMYGNRAFSPGSTPFTKGMPSSTMGDHRDPSMMNCPSATQQQTDGMIMMCYLMEQQRMMQQMLLNMLMNQSNQISSDIIKQLLRPPVETLQSQQPAQQEQLTQLEPTPQTSQPMNIWNALDMIKMLRGVSGGSSSSTMTMAQMSQTDQLQAEQTAYQMAAEREKHEWTKWKIIQDTQTKIFEIQQDVTLNRAKTQDKIFNKWDEYIRG